MSHEASESRVKRSLHAVREYLTHWAIAGAVFTTTGFAPEHWFADLYEHLSIPEATRHVWLHGFDVRIVLVGIGIALIAWDVHRRNKSLKPVAATDQGSTKQEFSPTPEHGDSAQSQDPAITSAKSALSDKPSIAVLPFQNISDEPGHDAFADGLVEDIITTLSKLSGLHVIARNSSFVYKADAVDVRKVADELGVRYVLGGSVRKSADRIRISAQLIDARSGAQVWAERYDRSVSDLFAIQDEITLILATEMQVNLTEGEQARLRYSNTKNVQAWNWWMQGLTHYRHSVTRENFSAARSCWEKALALDPNSSSLLAMLAFVHCVDARYGWTEDRKTALDKARVYVDQALALDPENADAHVSLGYLSMMTGDYAQAAKHVREAVQLAPSSADAAHFSGLVLAFSGFAAEAVAQVQRAITLNPNHPPYYLGVLGNAYRLAGQFDEAIAAFEEFHARRPGSGFGLVDLVIAYEQEGQSEQAKKTAAQLLSEKREFTITSWLKTQDCRADKAQVDIDAAALRSAGLPMG